jgi:hypothetical protein
MDSSLFAENYDREFEVPKGRFSVMADVHIFGDMVELQELSIYPIDAEKLAVGTAVLRSIYRKIEVAARQAGFRRLRITGGRITGASRGRRVKLDRRL